VESKSVTDSIIHDKNTRVRIDPAFLTKTSHEENILGDNGCIHLSINQNRKSTFKSISHAKKYKKASTKKSEEVTKETKYRYIIFVSWSEQKGGVCMEALDIV